MSDLNVIFCFRRAERTGDGSHPIYGKHAEKFEKTGTLEETDIAEILKTKDATSVRRLVTAQG